jgi:hypothetical protein
MKAAAPSQIGLARGNDAGSENHHRHLITNGRAGRGCNLRPDYGHPYLLSGCFF